MKPDPESIPAASPVDSSIHDDEILQENAGVVPSVNHIEGDQLDRIDIEELIKNNDPSISYHKPACQSTVYLLLI